MNVHYTHSCICYRKHSLQLQPPWLQMHPRQLWLQQRVFVLPGVHRVHVWSGNWWVGTSSSVGDIYPHGCSDYLGYTGHLYDMEKLINYYVNLYIITTQFFCATKNVQTTRAMSKLVSYYVNFRWYLPFLSHHATGSIQVHVWYGNW